MELLCHVGDGLVLGARERGLQPGLVEPSGSVVGLLERFELAGGKRRRTAGPAQELSEGFHEGAKGPRSGLARVSVVDAASGFVQLLLVLSHEQVEHVVFGLGYGRRHRGTSAGLALVRGPFAEVFVA